MVGTGIRRHDGEYLWILDSGVPRRHPDGTFAGHIGSAVDVTEIKAAEQVLSTMSQRLIEAHEQERAWIAAELHDDIGQRLVMLTMKLEFLKRAIPASQPSAIEAIQDVMQQAQSLAARYPIPVP
jgi:signal transduction histidine kinase